MIETLINYVIVYTEEEVETLKNILPWWVNEHSGLSFEYLWYSKIHSYEHEIILYKRNLWDQIHTYKKHVYGFLHCTPLEEVPLYIHDIPELARWRLMIAR